MGFGVNWIANVEEPGIYTIDITFDPEAADSVRINCVLTKTGDIEPVHYDGDVYIMGEVNDNGGWFTNVGVQMTRDAENNLYTATITTASPSSSLRLPMTGMALLPTALVLLARVTIGLPTRLWVQKLT